MKWTEFNSVWPCNRCGERSCQAKNQCDDFFLDVGIKETSGHIDAMSEEEFVAHNSLPADMQDAERMIMYRAAALLRKWRDEPTFTTAPTIVPPPTR